MYAESGPIELAFTRIVRRTVWSSVHTIQSGVRSGMGPRQANMSDFLRPDMELDIEPDRTLHTMVL